MDRSLSVWHFHAIKISKQGNRERKRREREKEKLKGMRMLLAFIALLSHPWHEQQLVCMVTSAFTWLWVLSREKMVHFEKKVIPSVKLRVMFCFRSICMEELFPSRFLYKGLYYNKEMAKNQSINATQTTQRIWSLQWASSLSSMADAQRPIYFPISCKGVCSQALGLFQSVLLSTLPMDNLIIRWYVRLIFFSSSSLFIITYLWGLAELMLRQPVRWMSDGTNQLRGPQMESLDMLEILEVLPKLCQSGWFVSSTETCLLLNQNGSLYSSWFRQYPQLDFEGD